MPATIRRRAAASLLLVLAATAHAQEAPPETLQLVGTVRDFREHGLAGGHPDFERTLVFGYGHYAGNVALELGPGPRPVFIGGGQKVGLSYRDAEGRAIAPHMYAQRWSSGAGAGGVTPGMATTAILADSAGRDHYEVTFLGAALSGDGTSSWTYRVRELDGRGNDLSHWNLRLDPSHVVAAGTTPGYDFGNDGSTGFFGIKWDVDDDFAEGEFTVVLAGHVQGVDAAEGVLAKGGRNPDTAAMFVPSTEAISGDGGGGGTPVLVSDPSLGDVEGRLDMADSGGITSAESFDQWFRDVPGLNLSQPLSLTFERQPDGSYAFDAEQDPLYASRGGFFPIDGQLFGNSPGEPDHNFHFTFELHSQFTYDAGAGQVFTFRGDDDVWVYIDGWLAIDIGGMHPAIEQSIALDRMGLVDGQTYDLDFFFAERHRTQSNFRITTNIALQSSGGPALVSAAFD